MAVALAVVLALGAACGDDDKQAAGDTSTSASTATTATTATPAPSGGAPSAGGDGGVELHLTAAMSGADEVPDPGLAGATGTADVRIGDVKLCYKLTTAMAEKPTAAHIHDGRKGAAGAVLVDLTPTFTTSGGTSTAEGCVSPDRPSLVRISYNADLFYVNVHTAEHPKGALRGQLARAAS